MRWIAFLAGLCSTLYGFNGHTVTEGPARRTSPVPSSWRSRVLLLAFVTVVAVVQAGPASIAVRADQPLACAAMTPDALIHTNREYRFTDVPAFLDGLHYTQHEHRNAAALNVRTTDAGTLYLALWGPAAPASLGLNPAWSACGAMGESTHTDRWTLYSRDVAAGEEFTLSAPDRWGAVLFARRIELTWDALQHEYDTLAAQIARWRSLPLQRRRTLEDQTRRRAALILAEDRDPADVVLRRTQALADDLAGRGAPDLADRCRTLAQLAARCRTTPVEDPAARRALFTDLCRLRRQIAFSNPLLDFDALVFLTHHKALYNHMVDQYFGFHARPGGGIRILEDPFGPAPRIRTLADDTRVANGRLQGRTLDNGSFLSLELDYDARSLLFAWTQAARTVNTWTPESTYHIFRCDIDGGNLVQLTDGPFNDFDPCILPNNRITFISERRGGYLRCSGKGGRPDPTYTLFRMDPDGGNILPLSYHETHEWHPSVDRNGMLAYTRWDYVDRDSDIAHHLWLCYPDGRDPRSYHGNYPIQRESRPWMEMSIRAIPDSHRYIAVAAPHHGQAYGSLVLIDLRREDDNAMSQLKRLTPEVDLPESEGRPYQAHEVYGSPWPLSEDYWLCVYDPAASHYGLYLVDSFGNRELLYRDPQVPCLDPIPLRPRPRPPVIPDAIEPRLPDRTDPMADLGTVAVMNVYTSDFEWPPDTKITALRIVQLFPKATPREYEPNVGAGMQSLARGVLGAVPVEPDGSAHFLAPIGMPLYFQALDEHGLAVQSMRSDTYLHPGERLTCQGCHEPKRRMEPNRPASTPLALRRQPSRIAPAMEGAYPVSFPRLVQPVLDRKCLPCHTRHAKAPDLSAEPSGEYGWSRAFQSLAPFAWTKHGGNGSLRINKTSRSIAGQVGARASRLYPMLTVGSHADRVDLTPEERARIALWLDTNSNFYGAYHQLQAQQQGDPVLPTLW